MLMLCFFVPCFLMSKHTYTKTRIFHQHNNAIIQPFLAVTDAEN